MQFFEGFTLSVKGSWAEEKVFCDHSEISRFQFDQKNPEGHLESFPFVFASMISCCERSVLWGRSKKFIETLSEDTIP